MKRSVRRLIARAVAALLLAAVPGIADELLLLSAPGKSAPPSGSTARFTVYGLNRGVAPLPAVFPETLTCRALSGEKAVELCARLVVPENAGSALVQPGAFVQREYEIQLPPDLTGMFQVEIVASPTPGTPGALPAVVDSAAPVTGAAGSSAAPPAVSRLGTGQGDVFRNFSPYEINYFSIGSQSPAIRFQFSFKLRLLNDEALPSITDTTGVPHVAYTQISLWDFFSSSSPFYDTSYKPEFFLLKEDLPVKLPGVRSVDLQYGVQHESNGKGVGESRSMNLAYVKPVFNFGDPKKFHLSLAPRFYQYIADMSDNRDMDDYRGYGDLTTKLGWEDGLMLGTLFRMGNGFKNGSTQLDFSYPMHRLPGCSGVSRNLFIFCQFFTGYGQCLLDYDKSATGLRLGVALSR